MSFAKLLLSLGVAAAVSAAVSGTPVVPEERVSLTEVVEEVTDEALDVVQGPDIWEEVALAGRLAFPKPCEHKFPCGTARPVLRDTPRPGYALFSYPSDKRACSGSRDCLCISLWHAAQPRDKHISTYMHTRSG